MPPTVTDEDYAPTAPPLDDEEINLVPTVIATASPAASLAVPAAMATAVPFASSAPPPRPPPNAAVPAGMVAKTITTTYNDGRQVTVTEYQPAASSSTGPAPASATASSSQYRPPRKDLGSRPVNTACPYCAQTCKTRTNYNCGDCTWISMILLLLFCFPFFWIPLICPSCQDVEHHCSNCGRLVGKSRAECCA